MGKMKAGMMGAKAAWRLWIGLSSPVPAVFGVKSAVGFGGANPPTGDTSGMMLTIMMVLLGASLLAILAVALLSAKKKKK